MNRTIAKAGRIAGALAAASALVLAGCAVPVTSASTSPSGPSAGSTTVAGLFDIGGGREMYLQCTGTGSPTVILISGLGGAADYWDIPDQPEPRVYPEVATFTRVCAYDRPGTVRSGDEFSRSDAAPQPTDQAAGVRDLHALLEAAGEEGPYVLAAHSYGGFIGRLYTATYPDDVSGLVLIDALSEAFAAALTPEEYVEWKAANATSAETLEVYPDFERLDFELVMAQMQGIPALTAMPLSVLSADVLYGPTWPDRIAAGTVPPNTPPSLGDTIDRAQRESQAYQAALLPDAVHITETHSGHNIPIDNAALVIDAIRDVVDRAR